MRGVHSVADDLRRNVFTEVARLTYEGGDYSRVDLILYKIVPGEVAKHRHDVFLERAIMGTTIFRTFSKKLPDGFTYFKENFNSPLPRAKKST